MAGDWIKIEAATPDKPEVDALAEALELSVNEVLGGLLRLWIWADQQTVDGNARSVTKSAIDRHAGVPGFAEALLSEPVQWLEACNGGGFRFPNFDRHMSQSAKQRALTARRVANHKARKGNAAVTPGALPREEKRRVNVKESTYVDSFCSEPSPKAAEPPVMVFPVVGRGGTEWSLAPSFVSELQAAYPGIEVKAECAKARAWCLANPTKRKTARGMTRFLNGWMERAQNAARAGPAPARPARPTLTREQREEEMRRYDAEHGGASDET